MSKYFPNMLCHFKFMDSDGKTFPPSIIVRKFKKVYDSMSPDNFMKWLYDNKKMVIFYCQEINYEELRS